jgi:hypothetical protein
MGGGDFSIGKFDEQVDQLLLDFDTGFIRPHRQLGDLFFEQAYIILKAHDLWRTVKTPDRYERALDILHTADQSVDWVVAAKEWMKRRQRNYEAKNENQF